MGAGLKRAFAAAKATRQPIPKPEPLKRVKARRKRQEAAVKKSVRQQVDARDGYCVIQTHGFSSVGPCEGVSEWAHIGTSRRCFTRGMAAVVRHTTKGSAKLCHKHHTAYDAHQFEFALLEDTGMDGEYGVVTAP